MADGLDLAEQSVANGTREAGARAALRMMAGRVAPVRGQASAAAMLGFKHLLLPQVWRAASAAEPDLVEGFGALVPGLGCDDVAGLVREAAGSGVSLVMDVVLDRVAAGGGLAAAGSPFVAPDEADLLDPRRGAAGGAKARLRDAADAAALAAWWGGHLRAWTTAGVAGFRLRGLAAFPADLVFPFATALRQAVPEALLLPWTPGLARSAVLALSGTGMDGVFASLPWWDGRADWIWGELDALLGVAPVLGMDAVPPGSGHGGAPRRVPAGLAALVGQGWLHVPADGQDAAGIRVLNAVLAGQPALAARLRPALPLGEGAAVLALLRMDAAEHRTARHAVLALINADPLRHLVVHAGTVLPAAGGAFGAFRDGAGETLDPGSKIALAPGQARVFTAEAAQARTAAPRRSTEASARAAAATPRLAIELPSPCVDGGRFPAKVTTGALVEVEADIVFDGHEKIAAALLWRGPGETAWQEAPMRPLGNDRWAGDLPVQAVGRYQYAVQAWRDRFETFRDELSKKAAAGLVVTLELSEGEALVREAAARRGAGGAFDAVLGRLHGLDDAARVRLLLAPDLAALMRAADDRPFGVRTEPMPVDAERARASFASWYEIFPRSMSDDPARHGTFADVRRHLPRIRDMGFDVLYFPPISPIGRVNRKGRNNTLTPAADDPGSPYAVGSDDGGHDALHPELGTLEDFRALQAAAAAHGLEIAIDFAIQCSPDHPWLRRHRGWFDWRPDGSIKYAENPPKKYEDIVNVDFYAADAIPGLWQALCDVVLFWAEQGIRIFRVDNPHTKPFPFWEWMIAEVRARYPDAMFLAEAFTRPKIMYRLAKIGFSQSYTYFTWRNEKAELAAYLTELNQPPVSYFFRPQFFVNTPDINPLFLQGSGRPGFLIRAALAATLSGLFGVYCGFELCEAAAVPGKEEYLDSEKYQLRAWDWDRPGNIVAEIAVLNRIRRHNPALQTHLGVTFLPAANDQILFYEKATPDRANVVLVAVSMDPRQAQEADIELPLWSWKIPEDGALDMDDLLAGSTAVWRGAHHRLRLTPEQPYAIWRARPAS
jgi:starch synthase (maltosyl-transferring)